MGGRGTFDKVGTSWSVGALGDSEQGSDGGGSSDDGGAELVLFRDSGEVAVQDGVVMEVEGGRIEERGAGEVDRSGSESAKGESREARRKQGGAEEQGEVDPGKAAARTGVRAARKALKVGGVVTVGGIALGHASVPEINIGEDVRGGLGIGE